MIERVELYGGKMPVNTRFSYGRVTSFDFLIIRISAGEVTGTGETLYAFDAGQCDFIRSLLGKDPTRLDDLLHESPVQPPGLREMVSMALHDLVAHLQAAPMVKLLGENNHAPMPVMPCLFAQEPAQVRKSAQSFVDQGYSALKIKLFGHPSKDTELVEAARRALPGGYIQGDLNCAYHDVTLAAEVLANLHAAGLDSVEDPLRGTARDHRRLWDQPQRPAIILDEPTRASSAIDDICRLRCCDAVNLHPCQQGTMRELLGRARVLRDAAVGLQVGGTGFTGIGSWAYAHIATLLGGDYPAGELGGRRDHGMPTSTSRQLPPVENGFLKILNRPGHGGVLDEAILHAYCRDHLVFG